MRLTGKGGSVDLGAIFAAEAQRPLVACDVDGVLAFTAEAVCTALNARFGTSRTPESLTSYPFGPLLPPEQARWLDAHTVRDAWAANLAPDLDAIAALAAIRDAGHRVIVSSDRPATLAGATVAWLDQWQVPRDGIRLDGPGSKRAALTSCGPTSPAVLVDDDPRKWLTVARPGVQVWTPRRPWTPDEWQRYPGVRVFTDWAQPLEWLSTVP